MRKDDYNALIRVAKETNSKIQIVISVFANRLTLEPYEKLDEIFTTVSWVDPNEFTWEEFTELVDWSYLYTDKNIDTIWSDGRGKAFNDVFEKYVPYSENFTNRRLAEVDIGLYRSKPLTK